ncbi:hypothetical protein V8E54_004259 [Elaphomyces granulatus]
MKVKPEFICYTFPSLHSDAYGVDSREDANPTADGWFFSDFFAMKYLLYGYGSGQVWMTSHSPEMLVQTYGEYLIGDPKMERKVVLDKTLV